MAAGVYNSPVLDDFNRANGAPGANWGVAIFGDSIPNIVSNQLDWPQFPTAYWAASTFAANQEVFAKRINTGAGLPENGFLLRFASPNTANESGYYALIYADGGTELFKLTSGLGSKVSLGFTNAGTIPSADVYVCVTAVDSTITVYSGTNGVTWTSRKTYSDSTHNRTGYIGLFSENNHTVTSALDDFGGGTIQSVATTAWFKA